MITVFSKPDREFEEFSLSDDSLFAIPLSVKEADGRIELMCYSIAEEAIKSEISKADFTCDIFSPAGKDRLISTLSPIMDKYGLSSVPETGDTLLEFTADTLPLPYDRSINTVILKTNEELSQYSADTTLWNLELDDGDPADVICAVIMDGVIVAYAASNDMNEGICEVTVECAKSFRRHGFATACAAGFAEYILTNTDVTSVSYVCRERNTASVKTAKKAGYRYTGKTADYVFYR